MLEEPKHLTQIGRSIAANARQHARDHRRYVGREARLELADRPDRARHDRLQYLTDVLARGRQLARQAFVENEPERPYVGTVIDVGLTEDLFWRHIARSPQQSARRRKPLGCPGHD